MATWKQLRYWMRLLIVGRVVSRRSFDRELWALPDGAADWSRTTSPSVSNDPQRSGGRQRQLPGRRPQRVRTVRSRHPSDRHWYVSGCLPSMVFDVALSACIGSIYGGRYHRPADCRSWYTTSTMDISSSYIMFCLQCEFLQVQRSASVYVVRRLFCALF